MHKNNNNKNKIPIAEFGKASDWPFGAANSLVAVMLVILAVVLVVRFADRRFGSRT